VTRELGRGGISEVYLAQDPFFDRLVAIKTILSSPPKDPQSFEQFHQRFFNQAQALGKLMHPHIVSVHDATVENDRCYLVMEYVDGTTLERYCHEKDLLPPEKVVKIISQCAKALYYAHQNGVTHRNIKPGNIMISREGEAKISDFGIAMVEGGSGLPQSGGLTGSAHYMSPERLRNEELTPQSDLFSLGAVMYELLTGTKPFQGDMDVSTLFKITNEGPESLKKRKHDVPESLKRIVMQALDKDLTKRYQTGLQMASELSASLHHLTPVDQKVNFEEKISALKGVDFFKDFTSSELAEVLKATELVEYEDTSTIVAEGKAEDCFYIISAGEVMVKKQGKPLAVLKKGECFGEMAYLGRTTRTATIEALGNTILMKINGSIIDQASINTRLRFYKVFSNTLTHRLVRSSELLTKASPDTP